MNDGNDEPTEDFDDLTTEYLAQKQIELNNMYPENDALVIKSTQQTGFYNVQIPGVEFNPEFVKAQTETILYTTEVVTDTDNPNAGMAIFDPETHIITIYMHDGYIPQNINDQRVQKCLSQKQYSIPIQHVVAYTINPIDLRTCKHFTAQRDVIERTPVSLSRGFDFDRPFGTPSCSSPRKDQVTNGYMCPYDQQQNGCPIYEPEQWTTEQEYSSEEQKKSWKLQSLRKGLGFKFYRVIAVKTETEGYEQIFTANVVEDPDNAFIHAEKTLYGCVDGIPDVVSVPVDNSQEIKSTYYEYAFANSDQEDN